MKDATLGGPRSGIACVLRAAFWGAVAITSVACTLHTSGLEDLTGDAGGASASATPAAPTSDDASSLDADGGEGPSSTDASVNDGMASPDAIVLDPDASVPDGSDQCDLDQDGHLATSCGGDDCCDYDGRAFPGETGYFPMQNACGSFDFDCNGQDEKQTGVAACKFGFFTCTGDGFSSDTGCGVAADFVSCNWAVVTCSQAKTTRTQACR